MRVYETTFIVNPQTDDATIDQRVSSVTDLITSNGGKVLGEDRMGTRRLAYPIQKLTQGYYHTLIYEAKGEFIAELDRFFRLNEAYLRHLTILFEGKLEDLKSRTEEAAPAVQKPAAAAPEAAATPEPAEETSEEPETAEEEKPVEEEPEEAVVAQSVPPETVASATEEAVEETSETETEGEAESKPEGESEEEEKRES